MHDSTVRALPSAELADSPWYDCAGPDSGHRERDVIAAFSEITTEAITATRLEGLLSLLGRKLCQLLGVMRCSVYLRRDDGRFRGAADTASGTVTSPPPSRRRRRASPATTSAAK
ncbi:hypothetical protein ACFSVJ_24135 [Prauserella oleivorans]